MFIKAANIWLDNDPRSNFSNFTYLLTLKKTVQYANHIVLVNLKKIVMALKKV